MSDATFAILLVIFAIAAIPAAMLYAAVLVKFEDWLAKW